jgi:hypothetical protein
MRLEYGFELSKVDVPRFAVEAGEEIGKLFTLGSLVLNVLDTRKRVEIVFHGLNPEDPARKIDAFRDVLASASDGETVGLELGRGGRIRNSSAYYQWISLTR